MSQFIYGNKPETVIRASARSRARRVNHVLLGSILKVVSTEGDWLEVDSLGKGDSGWVHKDDVRSTPILKTFFVDVGQGDGAIVESPEGIMLVDGGPNSNLFKFMKRRYRRILRSGQQLEIKAMVVSHPDYDHYNGLTAILKDSRFKVGTIYHNGIIRYDDDNLPSGTKFDLGKLRRKNVNGISRPVLTETFDTLSQAKTLVDGGHLAPAFRRFWQAALDAKQDGRLGKAKRITIRDENLPGYAQDDDDKLFVSVLGPLPTKMSGSVEYVAFPDAHDIADADPRPSSSHTRNGHSIVLKLKYGKHTILLGGDLNIPAQQHLMEHYGSDNPFRVDVAKACHHGSSDFHVEFLKKILPQVNVFSSGDNKSFDHPMADAVGAVARHTRGSHPLLFSTELARATSASKTHYGLINLRSNGDVLVMAQMKEQHKNKADIWDSFTVPWPGKFAKEIKESES
ncbi:MBL fold metallo-hydrolase [Thalassomonas sp. RHCl1]|uniref:MBL fold metallo-hydrolase n=1 Tax=Thalassomonas sp. RHCl1 TaxID=2995320 RepID=UPI00248BBAA9|nr:MBL fold metallo-hydrolase [Thalassomonas sp. RHCl1]